MSCLVLVDYKNLAALCPKLLRICQGVVFQEPVLDILSGR